LPERTHGLEVSCRLQLRDVNAVVDDGRVGRLGLVASFEVLRSEMHCATGGAALGLLVRKAKVHEQDVRE
jgi:hypothetical protein